MCEEGCVVLMLRMDVAVLPYMVSAVQDGTPAHHFPVPAHHPPRKKALSIQEGQSDLSPAQSDGWLAPILARTVLTRRRGQDPLIERHGRPVLCRGEVDAGRVEVIDGVAASQVARIASADQR